MLLTVRSAVWGLLLGACLAAVSANATETAAAVLADARKAAAKGESDAAREKYLAALDLLASADPRERLQARVEYAEFLDTEARQPRKAIEQFQQAVKTLRKLDADPGEVGDMILKLAGVEMEIDEDAAEASYVKALDIFLDELGPAAERTVEARALLGGLYLDQDWEEGAREQFQAALVSAQFEYGHSEQLARTIARISEPWRWSSHERAVELRDEALEIRENLHPHPSVELARTLIDEAAVRSEWDLDEQAVDLFGRAISMLWDLGNPEAPLLARAYDGLADSESYLGRTEEAESEYRTAVRLLREAGPPSLDLANALCSLGQTVRGDERPIEAIAPIRECLDIRIESLGEDDFVARNTYSLLAGTYLQAERLEQAEQAWRDLLANYAAHGEPYEGATASVWESMGEMFAAHDQEDDAIAAYERVAEIREETWGLDNQGLGFTYLKLRDLYKSARLRWKAKAVKHKINKLAWLALAEDFAWLGPMARTERLSYRVSPTGLGVMLFLMVGLVLGPIGGVASRRIGQVGLPEAEHESPPPDETALAVTERPRHLGRFHGHGPELFAVWAMNSLLTVLTAGVYYFWGKVRVRRYVWSHAEFARDRFAFHGTPMELFVGWLKAAPVLALIIWGPTIILMLSQSTDYEVWATLGIMGFALLLFPVAEVGAHRYRLSRTSWNGIRFSFHGTTWRYFVIYLLNWPLWLFTLGLWTPFFNALKRRFLMGHMRFGDSGFACDAQGRRMFKAYLVNWLLLIPTWGMYRYWYIAKREQYYWSRTTFRGARFRCTITGSQLFEISVIGGLLTLMTLGLAWPWVRCWRMRVWLESIQLDGSLDLAQVRQDPQAATATGEGYADFLGVDFGFFE